MYQALYRKYRPLTFNDVISHPNITTTLLNQVKNDKTAHAYLFTGSRGTGKTSCARILAKAINCLDCQDGNPCLKCEICKDADASLLSDIIEIDAASNNGVDDIRDLRDGAVYAPERCKYKVYIIDEVHMLSTNAFNALLKIMEEPPPYVKFILATTEVHKVPATILSRCQRFDFTRIKPVDIKNRLLYVAEQEKITLSDDAAELIARIADGGMRDALSLLDQCIAFSQNIDLDTVSSAAGIAGRDYLFDIIDCIKDNDISKVLEIVDNLYSMSKDITRLCEELISQFRNIMILSTSPQNKDLITCLPDEMSRLLNFVQNVKINRILTILDSFQNCCDRLSKSLNKRTEFEMCMIKLCSQNALTVDNSQNYVKIEQSVVEKATQIEPKITKPVSVSKENTVTQEKQVDFSKLKTEDFKPCGLWAEVLEEFEKVSPGVSGTLKGSRAFINEGFLLINVTNKFFISLFKNKENALQLGETVKNVLGKYYTVRARFVGEQDSTEKNISDIIKKAETGGIPVEQTK